MSPVHSVPGAYGGSQRPDKDTCAIVAAVLTPPVPPANDHKSAGAVGGEPEDSSGSPDLFDPGGDPDSIVEELEPPHTRQHQLELCCGK